jgi:micrococcal nuclease
VARASRATGLAGLLAVVAAAFLVCRGDPPEQPQAPSPPRPSVERSVASPSPTPPGETPREPRGPTVPVLRVVDGDTFHVLRNGRDVTIRLIGIDTPEVSWYGGEAECFGSTAGVFLRNLLDGELLVLEFDAERLDPYGRTLAYAYLADGRMVNLLLVRRGFAEVTIYEPNDRYETQLVHVERQARKANLGMWSACA